MIEKIKNIKWFFEFLSIAIIAILFVSIFQIQNPVIKDIAFVFVPLSVGVFFLLIGFLQDKSDNKLSNQSISGQTGNGKYSEQLSSNEKQKFEILQIITEKFELRKVGIFKEIQRLNKNSIVNLGIALIFSIGAFFILGEQIVRGFQNGDFLTNFLPRISITIVIEFFAFFFLRMYKDGQEKIKFFQNELTNIEGWISAIYLTMVQEKVNVDKIMEVLISQERNFILKQGETTVEIEKVKYDQNSKSDLANLLTNLLSKK